MFVFCIFCIIFDHYSLYDSLNGNELLFVFLLYFLQTNVNILMNNMFDDNNVNIFHWLPTESIRYNKC